MPREGNLTLRMPPQHIPLEDDPCDVIAKAMRGLGLTTRDVAEQSGLTLSDIQSALDGIQDNTILERIAHALGLSPSALAGLPRYMPQVRLPNDLHRITTPFGHAGVNAFIIVHGHSASVFDTGTNAAPILEFLDKHHLALDAVYITHRHPDHTAGTDSFPPGKVVYPEMAEIGTPLTRGNACFLALDVSGHLTPSRAYFYRGLSRPVCIVGDSIFAGSMGGTQEPNSYQIALKNITSNILSLPSNTILCPGHGPVTTVALEKNNNPYFLNKV